MRFVVDDPEKMFSRIQVRSQHDSIRVDMQTHNKYPSFYRGSSISENNEYSCIFYVAKKNSDVIATLTIFPDSPEEEALFEKASPFQQEETSHTMSYGATYIFTPWELWDNSTELFKVQNPSID